MTTETRKDVIGAVSVALTCELLIAFCIFIAAAIGCNVGALTAAVGQWEIFN